MKQGWEIKKLGDLCQIELGKTPYRGEMSFWDKEKQTDNVWLSIADLLDTEGDVVSNSKEYITDKAAKISKLVKKGTLLLSFKLTLGRLAFAGRDLYTNEAIAALGIKDEKQIDKYFLYHYLSLFDWNAATEGDIKVKGKTLNKAKLKEIDVHFPKSINEQQRIVSILNEAFSAIGKAKANAEQNLKNAKALFESYMQSVFEKKGEDWEHIRLGNVCQINDGTHFSPKNTSNGEYMYVTAKNIKPYFIDLTKISYISEKDHKEIYARCSPIKGDVLYIKDGATAGIAALNTLDEEFSLLSSVALLKCSNKILNTFLVHYMNSSIGKKNFLGYIDGAAITRLTLIKIKNVCFSLPSVKTQQTIVQKLDALQAETKKLEAIYLQKIDDLEELKKSILQKAFSGELKTKTVEV